MKEIKCFFFLKMTSFRNNFQGPRTGSRLILNELWVRSAKYFRIVWFDFCFTFCNLSFNLFGKKCFIFLQHIFFFLCPYPINR